MAGFGSIRSEVFDRVSRSQYYRDNLAGLTAHQRHQRLLAELPGGAQQAAGDAAAAALASTVTDEDVLRQHHRFLRGAAEEAEEAEPGSWGARLARRYYARLFKEYAIADLSRHKEGKIGMRWRTKAEVVSGRGQFSCGARGCASADGLATFEVPFAYEEAGQHKQALVKLRLCDGCAPKLTHSSDRRYRRLGQQSLLERQEEQRRRRQRDGERQGRKRERRHGRMRGRGGSGSSGSGSSSGGSGSENGEERRRGGGGGRKRRRPSSGGGGGGGARSEVLTDADIDGWLDGLFTAA